MSTQNNDPTEEGADGAALPTEEDLDSDVGTVFSDEEGGCKELDDDDDEDCAEGVQRSDDESGSSSSDSDDGSEKCPICLQRFSEQEIGTPEMCEHQFCLRCITAWSKKVATCPIDRKFFSTILVKKQWNEEVDRIEPVKFSNAQNSEEQYDSTPTYCEICGRCDREDRLLLCDGCDLGYHLECLDPPLEYIPIEDWFCPNCVLQGLHIDNDEPEIVYEGTSSRPPPATVRIPRTLQNERILQSIDVPMDPINDVIEAVMQGINAANTSSRPSTRIPKPRKSRKSTTRKRKSSSRGTAGGTSTRRKRRSKRKTKRRRRVAVDKRPNTARGRIAHHLGIMPPLPGQVYVGLPPACRSAGSSSHSSSASSSSITSLRYSAGITPLRMFGAANDLSELVESLSDEEGGPVSFATARAAPLHRSFGATLKGPPNVVATTSSTQATSKPGSCDVLGSILKKQYILLNDKNIKISRDGTLVPSISSSKLPHMATTVAQKSSKCSTTATTTSPSSSRGDGGSNSQQNRVQPRMSVCGINNEQRHNEPSNNQTNSTSSGSAIGNRTNSSSENVTGHGSSQGGGNTVGGGGTGSSGNLSSEGPSNGDGHHAENNDSLSDMWGTQNESQKQGEDDDFDIYSDIEENPQETEKTDSNADVVPPLKPSSAENCDIKSSSAVRKASQDSSHNSQQDDHDSDMDTMIIDEETEQQQSPQKDAAGTTSRRSSDDMKDQTKELDQDIGTPLEDESMDATHFPESPESIPLPDSPPPDIAGDNEPKKLEEHVANKNESSSTNMENTIPKEPKEYDPSEPLTSSDEDENSKKNVSSSSGKRRKSSPKSQSKPTSVNQNQGGATARNRRVVPSRNESERKLQSSTVANVDLRSIPIPPEEIRRPVIHFSIPKRHNLIPISSLMKRQKGVARKESKGDGSSINFQSEISKAFGADAQDDEEDGRVDDGDESLPKISLVAEIFGSDDDEEETGQEGADGSANNSSANLPPETEEEEQPAPESYTKPATSEPTIDVTSGRWKTVSEEVPQPIPPLESASKENDEKHGDSTKVQGSNPETTEAPTTARNQGSEDEPEIIEIVTLNLPQRPAPRRLLGPQDVETISDTSNSDIEVIDEVRTPKTRDRETDDRSKRVSVSRSRSRSPHRRRERKRRHSASSGSFCEEGEIQDPNRDPDGAIARKRRKDKRRKDRLKKSRVSKDKPRSGSARRQSGGDLRSPVSSVDEDGGDLVSWKKPKKSTERNYRGDKVKTSLSNERHSDRSVSPGYRARRGRGLASPRRGNVSPSLRRSPSRFSDRSASKTRTSWSRRRSRSGSSQNSYHSLRSSSRRHRNQRPSLSPHLHGHSRSPSRSPEPIRPRSSHVRRTRSISGDDTRDRSERHRRKPRGRTPSPSTSPKTALIKSQKKSKHSIKSIPVDVKKKRSKLLKKSAKSVLLKSKKRDKEQRLKEKIEKRKLVKAKSVGGDQEEKLFGGKSKSIKEKGERRRKKREKSLSPVKAIVADGDSIVVSLSFQKDTSNHGTHSADRSSSGKTSSKKSRESKQLRPSSKLKESSTKARSPSVSKNLLDLGAEDLSSNSESSSTTSNSNISREKEMGAAKVTSSGDGSTMNNYNSVGGAGTHDDDNGEIQGDSIVTSTRDSLEPSTITEDEYPNSSGSPSHSKANTIESAKLISQNVSSTAHSPRIQGSSSTLASSTHTHQAANTAQLLGNNSAAMGQKNVSNAGAASLDLMSSQAGPSTAGSSIMTASTSQSSQQQQMRYPPASNNLLNPVLATVASALLAARQQVPGTNANFASGGTSMSGIKKGKGRSSQGNYQGGDGSPMSPNSSDGDDLFEPPTDRSGRKGASASHSGAKGTSNSGNITNLFDSLFGSEPATKQNSRPDGKTSKSRPQNRQPPRKGQKKESSGSQPGHNASCDINTEDINFPASAVELSVQEKLINKINRQERVVEEVKVCLKPHYIKKHVNKEEYKEILRRAVPKICHSKTGEINPFKIRELVDAYVRKFRHSRKKTA